MTKGMRKAGLDRGRNAKMRIQLKLRLSLIPQGVPQVEGHLEYLLTIHPLALSEKWLLYLDWKSAWLFQARKELLPILDSNFFD